MLSFTKYNEVTSKIYNKCCEILKVENLTITSYIEPNLAHSHFPSFRIKNELDGNIFYTIYNYKPYSESSEYGVEIMGSFRIDGIDDDLYFVKVIIKPV